MKLLRTIITNYENEFKNELSEVIVKGFNENQKRAFQIILENSNLEDAILNKKIAWELYKCNPSYSTYKSFKETFSKILLKIVDTNASRGSTLSKISFELQDELSAINKLVYMGLRSSVKSQFKKTLKKALKYQNFEVARSVALLVVDHHALYGKEHDQIKATSEFKYINKICEQETTIKAIYGKLTKRKSISFDVKAKYEKILIDLEKRLEFDSFLYRCKYYLIKLILCDDSNYEEICKEAIDYFSNLWFNHSAYISIFQNKLLKYKISQGDFVKSKLIVNALMDDHRPFSYHWYLFALTYIRVLLYFGDNKEAYSWYHKVRDSRNYVTLPKDHRNECEVLGMYVYLMMDDVDRISIRKVKYNLNYNRTERSKENINFLIAEIIYNIKIGKPDIDKKVNNLQKIGKGKKRVRDLCKTLLTGKKYKSDLEASFDDEIVQYERLVSLI